MENVFGRDDFLLDMLDMFDKCDMELVLLTDFDLTNVLGSVVRGIDVAKPELPGVCVLIDFLAFKSTHLTPVASMHLIL